MNVDQEYIALIHAEIDGENTETDSALVREYLSRNPKARQLHAELIALKETLERVQEHRPPLSIRAGVFEAIRPLLNDSDGGANSGHGQHRGIGAPWLRYAFAFAAGLIFGVFVPYVVLQDQPRIDTSAVAGTIGGPAVAVDRVTTPRNIDFDGVVGSVRIERDPSSASARLEFDLDCVDATQIVLGYDDGAVHFRGVEQVSNDVEGLAVGGGSLRWTQHGHQRMVVSLDAPVLPATLEIRFLVSDEIVHREDLILD